jgi:hypothetical protein
MRNFPDVRSWLGSEWAVLAQTPVWCFPTPLPSIPSVPGLETVTVDLFWVPVGDAKGLDKGEGERESMS